MPISVRTLIEAASSTCSICNAKTRRGSLCVCHHLKGRQPEGKENSALQTVTDIPRSAVPAHYHQSEGPKQQAFVSYKQGSGPGGARELFFAVKLCLTQAGYEVLDEAERPCEQRKAYSRSSLPDCSIAVVLLSQDYLHSEACCAEAKEVAASGKPLLCLHDAKYLEAKEALDMGPLAFDLGLDALFRAPIRGLHSRDIDGCFAEFMEEVNKVLHPSSGARSSFSAKQKQALVSYKPGGGEAGSRDAFLIAKQLLKQHGYKVLQCVEEEPRKRQPGIRTALAGCSLAVVIVSADYFADPACRKEAGEVLDSGVAYFPVHDAKFLSAMQALDLCPRAAKYDLDAVFDRQIVPVHSQEPKLFASQWEEALKKLS